MKKLILSIIAVASLSVSSFVNAGIITSADVSSVVINQPANWTFANEAALFDGITANNVGNPLERFVGLRNNGAALSANNPFEIVVNLSTAQTITGLSFFNDWGSILNQQVMSMTIDLFASTTLVNSFNLPNLAVGFSETPLATGLFDANIDRVVFSISGLQATNFEIRELVINTFDQQVVNASAPTTGLLLSVLAGFVLLRRKFLN